MHLLFTGGIQFGRTKNNQCYIKLPNEIINILNNCKALFFNLENVIPNALLSNTNIESKDIEIYQKDVLYIRKNIKPQTFISTINTHTLDFGEEGYYKTLKLFDNNNFKFTIGNTYYIDNNFIYLNASDNWSILSKNKNCLLIDNLNQEEYTYQLISYLNKIKQNRILIFSLHWRLGDEDFRAHSGVNEGQRGTEHFRESTYLYNKIEVFCKKLCDLGVDVVFGNGGHSPVWGKFRPIFGNYYEMYNNKLIIYNLGYFINKNHKDDKSIILKYDNLQQVLKNGFASTFKNFPSKHRSIKSL